MICKKCGTEVPEDSKICPACGEPVETETNTDPFSVEDTIDDIKKASTELSKKIVEEGEKHVIPDIKSKESIFSFAGMIRKFAIYSMIAFFLPTLTVSCYGYNYKLSNYNAMVGSIEGESLGSSNLIVILFLLIPLLILGLHVFKKLRDMAGKKLGLITLILAVAELVMWVIYIGKVGSYSGYEGMIEVKTTLWFWINIICVLGTILLSTLVFLKHATFETPAAKCFGILKEAVEARKKPKKTEPEIKFEEPVISDSKDEPEAPDASDSTPVE